MAEIPEDVKRQALLAAQDMKSALKTEQLPATEVSNGETVRPLTIEKIPNLNRAEPAPQPDKE